MKCEVCGRELGTIMVDRHHLVPKTFGGKETFPVHRICHRKIHSVFTERELLKYYHTFDRIREHEQIQKFIKWVNKKPIDFYSGSDNIAKR
jgi:5-methylcytosine-specific restriction endonuclease McrA